MHGHKNTVHPQHRTLLNKFIYPLKQNPYCQHVIQSQDSDFTKYSILECFIYRTARFPTGNTEYNQNYLPTLVFFFRSASCALLYPILSITPCRTNFFHIYIKAITSHLPPTPNLVKIFHISKIYNTVLYCTACFLHNIVYIYIHIYCNSSKIYVELNIYKLVHTLHIAYICACDTYSLVYFCTYRYILFVCTIIAQEG